MPAVGMPRWPNMSYDADVAPSGWNTGVSDFGGFARPVPQARYVWFDFFRPEYDWKRHADHHGQPDCSYLRNRVARLTFNLKARRGVGHAVWAWHLGPWR